MNVGSRGPELKQASFEGSHVSFMQIRPKFTLNLPFIIRPNNVEKHGFEFE